MLFEPHIIARRGKGVCGQQETSVTREFLQQDWIIVRVSVAVTSKEERGADTDALSSIELGLRSRSLDSRANRRLEQEIVLQFSHAGHAVLFHDMNRPLVRRTRLWRHRIRHQSDLHSLL